MILIDTAMIGVLGNVSLAAVGVANYVYYVAIAVISGLAVSVQAMTSRREGEGEIKNSAEALNTGMLLGIIMAIPITVGFFIMAPRIFPLLNSNSDVITEGVPFLRIRLLAIVGVGINFSFYGFWNGINSSRSYIKAMLLMHIINIVLNYLLIFGAFGFPRLGAAGAAVGSTIATFSGTCMYFFLAFRTGRERGFLRKVPSGKACINIVRMAIPNGLQQLFFSGGLVAIFWITGRIGIAETAATNVLMSITVFALLFCMGTGLASGSLVSQAIGRGDTADARLWGWQVAKFAAGVMGVFALPLIVAPEAVLAIFLNDPHTISLARIPLQLTGLGIIIDGVSMVLLQSMVVTGYCLPVAVVALVMQWCFLLPGAYLFGPHFGYGLLGVWLTMTVYRILQMAVFICMWEKKSWTKVEI